jgi:hypothetical protein
LLYFFLKSIFLKKLKIDLNFKKAEIIYFPKQLFFGLSFLLKSLYINMEINTEFFIHLESTFNKLLYNNDINQLKFYSDLYDYSIKIQKFKHKDSRKELIEFYNDIIEKVKNILDSFLINVFEKIAGNKEILQTYLIEFNIFNEGLITINNLMDYFKGELTKLDTTYTDICFIQFGLSKWYENVTFKLIKYTNTKLCYYLDYKNKIVSSPDDENIYYLSELLDTVFYCMNKNLIDQNTFRKTIGNTVLTYLEKSLIQFETSITEDHNFLDYIHDVKTFQTTKLNELNLDLLNNDYNILFKSIILDKYEIIIKINFSKLLTEFDFNTFRTNYTINESFYTSLKNSILYCGDTQYIKDSFTNWLNGLIICSNNFPEILDVYYFMTMIVDKIDWDTESNNATIFKNIYTCFEPHFKQPKSTIENIDKYIRTHIYKQPLLPINYFYKMIINYFNSFVEKDDDSIFIYYKNYLVKRLYYYNFNDTYIKHELNIINSLTDNLHTSLLYKLDIVKKDLLNSKHLSTEFNDIYNRNSTLVITTDGIWNISPKTYDFSNPEFNIKFNTFKTDFTTFYNCKYENKKLDWNHQLSTCTLDYFTKDNELEIECSLILANILYEFNTQDYIEFNGTYSKRDFEILCHYRLIKRGDGNIFNLNKKFNLKSDKLVIKNNVTHKKIKKRNKDEIVFSQKELLELFIVRTVKRINLLEEGELLKMIKSKYDYDDGLINQTLAKLVDNNYLNFENKMYLYVI